MILNLGPGRYGLTLRMLLIRTLLRLPRREGGLRPIPRARQTVPRNVNNLTYTEKISKYIYKKIKGVNEVYQNSDL